jgi:chemotaxis protein MotA
LDVATLIGLAITFGTFFVGLFMSGSIGQYIDVPSLVIVFGGTVGASILAVDMATIKAVPGMVKLILRKQRVDALGIMAQLVRYAEMARREGILSLDKELKNIEDPFIQKAVQLLVDGTEPELIRDILETEIIFLEQRHQNGIRYFNICAALAPAFGFLGTLIGLIAMLAKLSEPDKLGPAMAVALVTTLYGVILSNMVFIPFAEKLKGKHEEEVLVKEMVIEGVMSIQSGDNPRMVEEKLKTFLPPSLREEASRSREKAKAPAGAGKAEEGALREA